MSLGRQWVGAVCLWALSGMAQAQVDLRITANPNPAQPGEQLEVLLHLSNTSGSPQANLVVELTTPAGLNSFNETAISDSGDCVGGSFTTTCEAGEILRWTIPALAAAQARRLTLPPIIAAATAVGTVIPFDARVLQGVATLDEANIDVTVEAASPLEINLDAVANPVAPGEAFDYVLSLGNTAASTLTDITLRLRLPPGTSLVSADAGGIGTADRVEWTLGALPPGLGTTRRARVAVAGGIAQATLLEATAEIEASGGARSTASVVTRVASASPLSLGIVANPDPAKPNGEAVEVELTAANRGQVALFDVTLEMRIPAGVGSTHEVHITGTGDCLGGGFTTSCESTELVRWVIASLPAGQGVTVVLPHQVAAATPPGRTIPFRGRVTATGGHLADASASVLVASAPRLDLALNVDRDPVAVGGALAYSLVFGNESATTSPDTALELQLPPGAQLLSASDGGTASGGSVSWSLGALPPRAGDVRRARVQLPAGGTAGELVEPVFARLRDATSILDEARASALTRTASGSPLLASVTANPDPARPNEQLSIEVVVSNTGEVPLADLVATLRVPTEVGSTVEVQIEGPGDCPSGTFTGSCEPFELLNLSVGGLAPGQSRTLAFAPRVLSDNTLAGNVIALNLDVRGTAVHPASASTGILIDDAPALDLVLDPARDPALPDQPLDLTLAFGNEGVTTRSLRLELPLPTGSTLVSASNGGKVQNGVVGWNLLPLPAQQGGTRRVQLQLPAGAGLLELPPARLFDLSAPFEIARASEVVQIELAPALRLIPSASPNPAGRGALLDVDFQMTNLSAVPLLGLVAQFRTPDAVNSFSEAAVTPAGDCLGGSFIASCEPSEILQWSLGQIDPSGNIIVGAPPVVANTAILGSHLRLRGRAFESAGGDAIARHSLRVGSAVDTDGDGIPQHDDNCPVVANASQADTDVDGRGDACECTDQNGDGRNTVNDLVAINVAIYDPGQITPLCDGDNDGVCNVNDIVAANLEIFSPTSTSTCARHPVPGP